MIILLSNDVPTHVIFDFREGEQTGLRPGVSNGDTCKIIHGEILKRHLPDLYTGTTPTQVLEAR